MSIWTPLPLDTMAPTKRKSKHRKVFYELAGFSFFYNRVVFPVLKNQQPYLEV
jgi:hypothetical protein